MKKVFFLVLLYSGLIYSQFSAVKEFPFSGENYDGNSKIIYVGENHLICFFGNDSLFSSNSSDNGVTWQEPTYIAEGELKDVLFYNNKIYLMFYPDKILISSDLGITWEGPYSLPRPSAKYMYIKHSDKFYVFLNLLPIYYFSSTDCINWGTLDELSLPFINYYTFIKFEENDYVIAASVYDSNDDSYKIKIFSANSLDGDWSDDGTIYTVPTSEFIFEMQAAQTEDGKYWLAFSRIDTIAGEQKDIFYMTSTDGGATWSNTELFARSFQDDVIKGLSESPDFPIATFISRRNDTWELYYGKLSESQDISFSPYLSIISKDIDVNYSTQQLNVNLAVKAFTWNSGLNVEVTDNGATIGYLYDDGMHGDGAAGDSVYANNLMISYNENSAILAKAKDMLLNETEELIFEPGNLTEKFNDDYCRMNNGNVSFVFNNKGIIADVSEAEKRGTFYDDYSVMYSGGFYLSGYSDGTLWANAMATASRVEDYVPGNVGAESGKIYYVRSSDPAFGESWQAWAEAVEHGAKFYDGNGDGSYNPVDLNGNGVWDENEDAPEINGTITAWCVYNDGVPASERAYTDVEPQGIEIRQTIWTNKTDPDLKNVFFVRYSIYNTGTVAESLDSIYFGVWTDDDVGNYVNDLLGSSPNLLTGYTYDDGEDDFLGNKALTVMKTLLYAEKFPVNDLPDIEEMNGSFVQYMSSHPTQGDPFTKEQARYYLLGLNQAGEVINPCDWPFGAVLNEDCSTIDGRWMYSGNLSDSTGWINIFSSDQRSMLNIGPFNIASGESVEITVAYHFSQGETNIQSVALGLDKAQYLRDNALVLDADESSEEVPDKFTLYQNYPNPFNPTTTIKYSIPNIAGVETQNLASLRIYNVLGEEVATLVNEKQAPGNYSVQFDASNLSSGVYFYKLQYGNFVATKKMILLK